MPLRQWAQVQEVLLELDEGDKASPCAPHDRGPTSPARHRLRCPGTQPIAVLAVPAQLTPSERESLQEAVSASYIEERGLKERSHGKIVNERGRAVFLSWALLALSARYL